MCIRDSIGILSAWAVAGCTVEPRIFECLTPTECTPGMRCIENICVGSGNATMSLDAAAAFDGAIEVDPDASVFADASVLHFDATPGRDATPGSADAAPVQRDASVSDGGVPRPTTRYVAWIGDTTVAGNFAAFVADVSGATPGAGVQVSPAAPNAEATMNRSAFSADNTKIAFFGDLITDGIVELFVVDLTGPRPAVAQRASAPLASPANVVSYTWSPDSRFLYYSAGPSTRFESYVVDVSGATPGAARKVSGTLVAGGSILGAGFSPDSSRVVYIADQEVDEAPFLYVATLAGGAPAARINDARVPAINVSYPGYTHFVRGSQGIVFVADQRTAGIRELWLADLDAAAAAVRLSGNLPATGEVFASLASPDGSWVVYVADQNVTGDSEVFAVDLRGATPSAPLRLNGALTAGGDAFKAVWSPDSSRLVYLADQDLFNTIELYVVGVGGAGPGAPIKVNTPFVPTQDVDEASDGIAWSPDGRWVAYRADVTVDEQRDLFVARVTPLGPSTAVRISSVGGDRDVGAFAPTPTTLVRLHPAPSAGGGVAYLFSQR